VFTPIEITLHREFSVELDGVGSGKSRLASRMNSHRESFGFLLSFSMPESMTMADGSVTCWIENLKGGDLAAAQPLWDAYFRRLVELLPGIARRVTHDEIAAKLGCVRYSVDRKRSAHRHAGLHEPGLITGSEVVMSEDCLHSQSWAMLR
jgi:hypothetical protein